MQQCRAPQDQRQPARHIEGGEQLARRYTTKTTNANASSSSSSSSSSSTATTAALESYRSRSAPAGSTHPSRERFLRARNEDEGVHAGTPPVTCEVEHRACERRGLEGEVRVDDCRALRLWGRDKAACVSSLW